MIYACLCYSDENLIFDGFGNCRFFSVVRPGDTVNVIGDFVDGKCRIDQHNNLLIVHPDILISGSKVNAP